MMKQLALPIFLLTFTLILAATSQLLPVKSRDGSTDATWPSSMVRSADEMSRFSSMLDTHFIEPEAEERRAVPLEGYEIIGVVETEGRDVVLISRNGQVISLGLGDRVDGYTLVALADGAARFEGQHENVVLELPY